MGCLKLTYHSNNSLNYRIGGILFGQVMPNRHASEAVYKYGFNGHEKDDEIGGSSNFNTAEFWEYDARIGRRWNLAPKPSPYYSSYSAFRNNPTCFSDPNGDFVLATFLCAVTFEFAKQVWTIGREHMKDDSGNHKFFYKGMLKQVDYVDLGLVALTSSFCSVKYIAS